MKHEKILAEDATDRTKARRAEVTLLCEVRQGSRPWKLVRLEDISAAGFRIKWLPECTADRPLRVKIPGIQILSAKICWQRGKAVGCEFAEPLHVA
ncbi:MAG: PilZ domain-containing protein, partial [Novosphingobium sp.]